MYEVFSDSFACRTNRLTVIDPRTKLVVAVSLILAVIVSDRPLIPLCVGTCCVAIMLVIRIPLTIVLLRLVAPMGIVAVLIVLKIFLTDATPFMEFNLFGRRIIGSQEGLYEGLLVGSRVLGSVSVVLLLSFVSPANKIFHALRWFRVPETWVEVALLVYRYVFILIDQTADVILAQKMRLGYSNVTRSLNSAAMLAGTVMGRSMEQAMRTFEAMTLRGYTGKHKFAPLPDLPRIEWAVIILVPSFLIVARSLWDW
jgi:cobalt/nickel transport system permease protein